MYYGHVQDMGSLWYPLVDNVLKAVTYEERMQAAMAVGLAMQFPTHHVDFIYSLYDH